MDIDCPLSDVNAENQSFEHSENSEKTLKEYLGYESDLESGQASEIDLNGSIKDQIVE